MKVLDLFSGIGGFSLGLERAGFETVAFCEIDPYCRAVLKKHWPDVPCYEDVRELTAERLKEDGIWPIDLICGGFPCQDATIANTEGKGVDGERTKLYSELVRLACEIGCPLLMENVPGLLSRGYGAVLAALAKIGFHAEWESISAVEAGADHIRERLLIFAYPAGTRWERPFSNYGILESAKAALTQHDNSAFRLWRELVDGQHVLRSSDGLSLAMERRRLSMNGNTVVPVMIETIGKAIKEAIA